MRVESLRASALSIPFRATFRHAAAERRATQAILVEARADGRVGVGEGCPREYVTGESVASALAFVARHAAACRGAVNDVPSLREYVRTHRAEIDAEPAAWCALELALLDLLGKAHGVPVEQLLGVAPLSGEFAYTAVLGDATPDVFAAQLARYRAAGFRDFKVKLTGDFARDRSKVAELRAAGLDPGVVRADANNLFASAAHAIEHLAALGFSFRAIEEPIAGGDYRGLLQLAHWSGTRIVLDESLVRIEQLDELPAEPGVWIANVRVSKMGGLIRSLLLADAARRAGMGVIVGAHVGETSILARAALCVASGVRDVLLAQEGAFGTHLLERDVVDPPIMFGRGGILAPASLGASPGLGLAACALSRSG